MELLSSAGVREIEEDGDGAQGTADNGGSGKNIQEKRSNERSRMNLELGALALHIGGWTKDMVMNNDTYYI